MDNSPIIMMIMGPGREDFPGLEGAQRRQLLVNLGVYSRRGVPHVPVTPSRPRRPPGQREPESRWRTRKVLARTLGEY